MFRNLQQAFFQPIDNSQIVIFRILFGLLMAVESFGAIATGWVRKTFIEPSHHFPFIWMDWLSPLPGDGMYYYFVIMGIISLLVAAGIYYRWSALALALLWSGCYFMQKTSYNNHYYLAVLFCWFMVLISPHLRYSWDSKRKKHESDTCPNWYRWFFIFQFFIFFSYASIAKFSDSWLSGDFIALQFSHKTNYFLIGPLLAQQWFQWFIVYSGILFDALISPLLLWRKTRIWAFATLILFNLFNSAVFQIGIFPYMVVALAIFFFEPDQIRKLFFSKRQTFHSSEANNKPWFLYLFIAYFIWQLYLPLRHHFIPGDVLWTEEGHKLSWRMMLRSRSGKCKFVVKDAETGKSINVREYKYLSRKQLSRVTCYPDMTWQFAQILAEEFKKKGINAPQVYVKDSKARINRGEYRDFIDPNIDLAHTPWNYFGHNEWILIDQN
ncbi:HTTM domain-containing protein [Reichenbachiella ulvae]|uniref:HTTM domain-containing protein n=1 Tax=Reichenbachiella ulvae TaxID=2980104 RepID=A0ABT3CNQ8_9BACT|nr:HTTM domain-containing protein [Reichenbachiella ulvae]MCV9385326.1 HTTM domain-containing protein [Reichenbachiella ulvae]